MVLHVVRTVETVENAPLIGRDRSCDLAVHDGEARERAQPSAHELPRNVDVAMADAVHVRTEGDPIGIETARKARAEAGLDPNGIAFGAYVNCVSHRNIDLARELVSGGLSTFARFSVMHGEIAGPVSTDQRRVLDGLHRAYDMKHHTRVGSPQAKALTPEFIDGYAVVGSPDRCVDRLRELAVLGIERIIVIGPTAGADRDEARKAEQMFASEVLPALRS